MSKTNTIREAFETNLVEVLQGRVLIGKEGEPLMTEDGRVAVGRPGAPDLSVVRAYLKDQMESQDPKGKSLPVTGQPKGVLASYLDKNPLPFGSRAQ